MNALKEELLRKAREKYFHIYPCGSNESLADCFTIEDNTVIFWFNTGDRSTHMISAELA